MAMSTDSQREKTKAFLRKQMVVTEKKKFSLQEFIHENQQKILISAIMVVTLLILIAGGVFVYQHFRVYTTYQVKWSAEINNMSAQTLVSFGNGVAVVGKDGVICYDQKGANQWSVPYDMKSPTAVVQGDYLLVYDRDGQNMVICGKDGKMGNVSTSYPVSRAEISAGGVVAAVLEDTKSSYISYYRNNGEKLEVEIQSPLATNGYPRSIGLSPNGQQLAVSYIGINGLDSSCRVDFYDFELGREMPNRIVSSFSYQESDTYIPVLVYTSNENAFGVGTNQLSFYSAANRTAIKETTVPVSGEIQKMFYNDNYLGLVVEEDAGMVLRVYHMNGSLQAELLQEEIYENYGFSGKQIFMYDDSRCRIVTFDGREKFFLDFVNGIRRMIPCGDGNSFYLTTMDMLQKITLK
ncbi:MAG: hypothetical protein IJ468_00595 [Lachnospiraceae bacterium]|nr:hypothetical protein [Lachnospiraceae bacterium]